MNLKALPWFVALAILTGCIGATAGIAQSQDKLQAATVSIETPLVVSTPSPTAFTLSGPDLPGDGKLPVEYTCDGDASTPALVWGGAPEGTKSFALLMDHIAAPDDVHWYWVLYDIPADTTSLPKNVSGIGTLGNNINNGLAEYSPPCSQGPGEKTYTFTVFALSQEPTFDVPAEKVDRANLLEAIKDITLGSASFSTIYARAGMADPAAAGVSGSPQENQGKGNPGGTPPLEAVNACSGKAEQQTCSFTSPKGIETGVCKTNQNVFACAPDRNNSASQSVGSQQTANSQPGSGQAGSVTQGYNIEQAISDKAQGMTISFDALAFLTGDLGSDSFFPPGKVADFWGFQYLRDNDPSQMGHAGDFLTSAAMNALNNLSTDQRAQLISLAKSQVAQINDYGYRRFVLMDAFRRQAEGDLPAGTTGLNGDAVKAYSAGLYQLDGEISYARAELMGKIISNLSTDQKTYFDAMKGKGMKEWPDVEEPADIKGLDRDVKVAVMTYAADLYSWYAGSVDADVYFCPERHGTYFGSFYLKDIKAMSDPTFAIPTDMTGDLGEMMLQKLTPDQSKLVTGLVDTQKPSLLGIVNTRRAISTELRKFMTGGTADKAKIMNLMNQYGAYDGEIIYNMAVNFSKVSQSLTDAEKAELTAMRTKLLGDQSNPTGAYLYSQAIPMPSIPNTDFYFK
jgi:Raf kinase inhibitor-like YbhB/YbcL family protein